MTVRKVTFSIGEFYHLYNRGVDKRPIFLDVADRERFVRLLYLCNGTKPVSYRETKNLDLKNIDMGPKLIAIGSYCLMSNHFHLLTKEVFDGGTVKFMSKLLTGYSTYFNKKYTRTGTLFSSEFKSAHLDKDEYLKYMFAYIHLNPLKILDSNWREKHIDLNSCEAFLNAYDYSSYLDYVSSPRTQVLILNKIVFPQYFSTVEEVKTNLFEWINLSDQFTEPSPR